MFNALPLSGRGGGVSTYIRGLLGALAGTLRADLFAAVHPSGLSELPDGVSALVKEESHGIRRAVVSAAGFGSADLTHGLDVDLPLRRPGPTVSTVHDMAIVDAPWAFPRFRVAGERVLLRLALRRADGDRRVGLHRRTGQALTGRDAVVIRSAPGPGMVPPSPDEVVAVRSRYRLPDRFVLHVGNIEPRKDIATLATACRSAALPLVLTGHSLWGHRAPEGAVEIGHVPDADLPGLYGAATVVGYASRYEGFGLPPIEAMACGAAVVSTPVPAVVEVAGDGAATFVPGDAEGLTVILDRLLSDEGFRSELAERGRQRAATLSWARTAAATADVYRSLGLPV